MEKLEAPFLELQGKAQEASDAARAAAAAAAKHRKQATELARQAAAQREDARRLTFHSQHIEADAANLVAER